MSWPWLRLVFAWTVVACTQREAEPTALSRAEPEGYPSSPAESDPSSAPTDDANSASASSDSEPQADSAAPLPDALAHPDAGTVAESSLGAGGSGAGGSSTGGGAAGASGGAAGSVGVHNVAPLRECVSSDGSGCEPGEVCIDVESDACVPGFHEDCVGYCSKTLPHSSCGAEPAVCFGEVTCLSVPEVCPEGLVRSIVAECWGPCVAQDCCACTADRGCSLADVTCDAAAGRCVAPASPEPRCFLPFEPGACDQNLIVFAFVDGQCQEFTAGQCDANDHRFFTLEECLKRCEGLPQQGPCPDGRVPELICLECGGGGGCSQQATVCAKACETQEDCDFGTCEDGVCRRTFCI